MKKYEKRIISILLAFILILSSVSCAFSAFGASITPRLEDDGKTYVRLSYDEEIKFYTDFNDVIREFKTNMLGRVKTFSIPFATCDPDLIYHIGDNQELDEAEVEEISIRLINKALVGAFSYDASNPYAGDFLYHSINASDGGYSPSYYVYPCDRDIIDGVQYCCYKIGLSNIDYYTDMTQEDYFHRFVEKFNEVYIDENYTDYQKVKTIYDFIVRNIRYDDDVRNGEIAKEDPRFDGAHSAYGAICGNIKLFDGEKSFAEQLASGKLDFDKHFDEYYKTAKTVEGQNVEDNYNNGLAVCEGYSKLFYALCTSNGIKCHIIDGNYADGVFNEDGTVKSDPHEWNYVWLDDGVGDDGPQWYIVDTTYASNESIKQIDYNSYDYFLVGTDNSNMSKEYHPIPYKIDYTDYNGTKEVTLFDVNDVERNYECQLYDWYNEYKASATDYKYPQYTFDDITQADDNVRNSVLIYRQYELDGKTRRAYILTEKDKETNDYSAIRVEIDENGKIAYSEDTLAENLGFTYHSLPNTEYRFHFMIPYVVISNSSDIIVNSSKDKDFINAGKYFVKFEGAGGSSFDVAVPITQLNMSNDDDHKDNYSSIKVDNESAYSGSAIKPEAQIIDGFNYVLKEGIDYDIKVYEDPEHLYPVDEIKNMGEYYIRIEYKGNYIGFYSLQFVVSKIDLSLLGSQSGSQQEFDFSYIPEKLRAKQNINDVAQYFLAGASGITIGDIKITPSVDYNVSYSVDSGDKAGMAYNSSGKLYLTGASNSQTVKSGSVKAYDFKINEQFDVSNFVVNGKNTGLNNQPAYSKTITYTGSPIKLAPEQFDNVNEMFTTSEYEVVDSSYSNNINAGNATVEVKGKGGCKGTAKMYFVIAKKQITSDIVTAKQYGNSIYVNLKYNGMTLKNGTDYTIEKKTDEIIIKATENSNYIGIYDLRAAGIGTLDLVIGDAPAGCQHTSLTKKTSKATTAKNGYILTTCNDCGAQISKSTIYYPKTVTLSATKYTYDGKVKTPTVKVVGADGKTISASNYKVTYSSGRKNVGKYTVKITFNSNSNCTGSISTIFYIIPKGTTVSSLSAESKGFTVKWKKQASQTTGYQIQIATDSKFTKNVKTYTVSKNSTVSKKITGLKAKTKYYVRIRTYKSSSTYASGWNVYGKTVTTKK